MKRTIGLITGLLLLGLATVANAADVSMDSVILVPRTAPGSPVNGQCWTTSVGMFCRIAGSTVGPFGVAGGTVTSVSNPTVFGVTCSVANATTTPTITCPTSGALTIGSVNGLTITPTTAVLTLAAAKTLTVSNTLTFTGTDASTLNIGAGGTLGAVAFITPGTGIATALGVNVGSAGAPVLLNGAGGTPSSLTLTNATGLPVAGGGTGATTLTANGLVLAHGTSAFTALPEVDGDCVVGAGGSWTAGSCTGGTVGTPTNAQTGTTYTVLTTDQGKIVTFNNASPVAVTLPQAGTTGFAATWGTCLLNIGAGTVTVTPTTSTFNLNASQTLPTGAAMCPVSDGTNYAGSVAAGANTNASALTSGTLAAARGGAGTINGALKGNGSGVVSVAASTDLSDTANIDLLNATQTITGTKTFGTVIGGVNAQTGTTYTLQASDCGQTVKATNASAITVTTFQAAVVGCVITIVQNGAGQITFANGGSATLVSAHSYTKTFNAAGATVTLQVLTNAGSAAVFTLSGDGA